MKRAPTNATDAGRTYLELQRKARAEKRPTDELLQLFALEAFLDRLSTTTVARSLTLKGGVLLAAYDTRRPTRDVDLSARGLKNSVDAVVEVVQTILDEHRADGWVFGDPKGDTIREQDEYSGVRVTVPATLAKAPVRFHIDVNFGDPVWPEARLVTIPRLLGGTIVLRGYAIETIYAEKIVTALQRGLANTRWRDFADIYLLSGRHSVRCGDLSKAVVTVAQFRGLELSPLRVALQGFAELAQSRWRLWVQKQRLDERLPIDFSDLIDAVCGFSDMVIEAPIPDAVWNPVRRAWESDLSGT